MARGDGGGHHLEDEDGKAPSLLDGEGVAAQLVGTVACPCMRGLPSVLGLGCGPAQHGHLPRVSGDDARGFATSSDVAWAPPS